MKQHNLIAALLCAASTLATAQDDLDEVVVTATRNEQHLTQTLLHTTVISQRDIQSSGATDVPTLLRSLAGVEIYQSGGIGKQSSLFMRGTNSSHTLVLLDGVRINSATTGTTAIDQLMLDQVERIEVVRGNVSSLYGSEAIGGVIQIFTKRGKGKPSFNSSVGAGSQNTQRASAGFGGAVVDTTFNVQVSKYRTDGVSAINPALANNVNSDKDGYDNTSASVNVGYDFNADHHASVSYFETTGDAQFDNSGFFANASDAHSGRSKLSKQSLQSVNCIADSWESRLTLAQGKDDYQSFLNGVQGSSLTTSNDLLAWQNSLLISEHSTLVAGLEKLKQRITSNSTAYMLTNRTDDSLFAAYTGNYDKQQVQLNLRSDKYSDFGTANTWLLGYGVEVMEAWRVTANISTAFKTPTFNDMHAPSSWGSNPNLKPERSRNSELGAHFVKGRHRFDAVYFDNRISDLIVSDTNWVMQNLNEASIKGVELAYDGQFGETGVRMAVTQQEPRDAQTGLTLLRRARSFSSVGVTRQIGALKIGGEWRHSGERADVDISTFARTTLAAYDVGNLTASYALSKELTLSARVDNLFNRDYMLAHGYNTLGRVIHVGLNYQP
ncbi:MAG: TonB-dependent receptor [Sideroxydans sp.]|nr:TonB-dependent receptor [Sideroxydans sp.]